MFLCVIIRNITNLVSWSDLALPFDKESCKIWGEIMAKNPHNPVDKQLTSIALANDLILVTRNVKDIVDTGVKYLNPFE